MIRTGLLSRENPNGGKRMDGFCPPRQSLSQFQGVHTSGAAASERPVCAARISLAFWRMKPEQRQSMRVSVSRGQDAASPAQASADVSARRALFSEGPRPRPMAQRSKRCYISFSSPTEFNCGPGQRNGRDKRPNSKWANSWPVKSAEFTRHISKSCAQEQDFGDDLPRQRRQTAGFRDLVRQFLRIAAPRTAIPSSSTSTRSLTIMPAAPIQMFEAVEEGSGPTHIESQLSDSSTDDRVGEREQAIAAHTRTLVVCPTVTSRSAANGTTVRSPEAGREEAIGLARAIDLDVVGSVVANLSEISPRDLSGQGQGRRARGAREERKHRPRREWIARCRRCSSAISRRSSRRR